VWPRPDEKKEHNNERNKETVVFATMLKDRAGTGATLATSLAVIESLDNAGLVIVPQTPSDGMLDALCATCGVDRATAHAAYRALLDAVDRDPAG
jgi:hypothetical protein